MEEKNTKQYTEKQLALVDALFGEACGNIAQAKLLAGYSKNSNNSQVIAPIKELIVERAEQELAMYSAKAVRGITGLIDEPTQAGASIKLAAAKELLDRIGVIKTDKVQHSTDSDSNIVFILPSKEPVDKHEDNEI